jgi:4,5-DOPA dioxygenase extradiol
LPVPKAILCISAHWETWGTLATAMEKPRTIHDFGGFPKELFDVQYPAPGSPGLAGEVKRLIKTAEIGPDKEWGLDHGCWSVIRRMYPDADIPVIQLSLDYNQKPRYHYELAKQIAPLRGKGILIVGSGNIVHNLRLADWDKMDASEYGYDWAIEASAKIKKLILTGDHRKLMEYKSLGRAVDLAVPTPEHFLPLLYALALKEEKEEAGLFNDKPVAGSLTMTCVRIG